MSDRLEFTDADATLLAAINRRSLNTAEAIEKILEQAEINWLDSGLQ